MRTPAAGFELVCVTWGSRGTTLHRNGAAAGSQKGVDAVSSDPGVAALRLGGPGSGGSPRFRGDLAEVRVYDRQLDENERRLVEAELRAAWFDPTDPKTPPSDPLTELYEELLSARGPFWLAADARRAMLPAAERSRLDGLCRELDALKKKPAADIPRAVVVQDGGPKGTRHEGFKDSHVFLRGNPKRLGKTVPRGVPRVLLGDGQAASAYQGRERPPRTGRMAGTSRQSSDGPRHGQPDLAAPLRRGPGPHAQRLWRTRRAADKPRAARLAGRAVRGVGLVGQGDAPAHHAVIGLSAEQPRRRRSVGQGPGQPSLRPNEPPPP